MTDKFPRTPHLPWSPGGTRDDRRLDTVDHLLGIPLVITEKLDGSNICMTYDSFFARSHGAKPTHASFDLAKAYHGYVQYMLQSHLSFFFEYCFAVHSIKYDALPAHIFLIGVRDEREHKWLSWADTHMHSDFTLKCPTVPPLESITFSDRKALVEVTEDLARKPSMFGGEREGIVIRPMREFRNFDKHVAKWVRKDHVKTDDHWKHQPIVVQNLKKL